MDRRKFEPNRWNASFSFKTCVIWTFVCIFCICRSTRFITFSFEAIFRTGCLLIWQPRSTTSCSLRLLVGSSHIGGHLHAKFVLFFDVTVQSSRITLKTTLCRMLNLIGLVAFAEIHLTGYRFREMPTTLKTGESSYAPTNVLANALWPANLCE